MPSPKKFGAFSGVFTPSILTILGVIMYMRLGWVVGEAGLIYALVIILIAHIISVTTGLSISSIATDKKIKAGGIYYILSRSLGLPMGGAIGIVLFIGTALSISLYLVGFAENFLSIEAIRDFLQLEQNVEGYRIIGTGAIIILVLIAFISTSLAIKTQFYILAAIGLSLISIFTGFFLHGDLAPESIILTPVRHNLSMELIFAIFFPAVTGFTAGVAMSGDLKDPKKSIPFGTLGAITIGFLVYAGLAIALAVFVNRDLLINDYNFLLKVAWIPALVFAGIWGATLSSALGGILGGPRILQAVSADKITPKIFAKGYGSNNEPRNALLFIFLIAEGGILIGDLDKIAGIVSMFYLASYGFINLAFFLESWASPDFRPTFKVSRYIGLLGFVAAFGVMFKLDMAAMFGALIIMAGLYFYLKRKQLKTDYGDIWQSVYSSVVRSALVKMDRSRLNERNWQPNIILFSGGTGKRPYLIELGKSIAGKHGALSNFDLIEDKEAKVLFPKHKQSIDDKETGAGVFSRRQTVKDIYDGIETIARVYGFSGYEPNTLLLGWARQTSNPVRFVEMLNTLYELDMNVLLVDYDKNVGFGDYSSIDIWWKDESNQGNLALTLSKLTVQSEQWQNAEIRLIIVNSKNDQHDNILRKTQHLLNSMRMEAKIRIINNEIDQKPYYDLMMLESRKTDLIISGIPELEKNHAKEFIERTSELFKNIGTVLLIRASSTFRKLNLGIVSEKMKYISASPEVFESTKQHVEEVVFPHEPVVENDLRTLYSTLVKTVEKFHGDFFIPAIQFNEDKTFTVSKYVKEAYATLKSDEFLNAKPDKQKRQLASVRTNLLIRFTKVLQELQEKIEKEQKEGIEAALKYIVQHVENLCFTVPLKRKITIDKQDLQAKEFDNFGTRFYKFSKRLFHTKSKLEKGIPYPLKLKKLIDHELPIPFLQTLHGSLRESGQQNEVYVVEYQKLQALLENNFNFLEQNGISKKLIVSGEKEVLEKLGHLQKINKDERELIYNNLLNESARIITAIGQKTEMVPANRFIAAKNTKKLNALKEDILGAPSHWHTNRNLLYNGVLIDLQLSLIKQRLKKTIEQTLIEIDTSTEESIKKSIKKLSSYLKDFAKLFKDGKAEEFKLPIKNENLEIDGNYKLALNKITDKTYKNIKAIIGRLPKNIKLKDEEQKGEIARLMFEDFETINISAYRLIDYYIQSNLLEPLLQITSTLSEEIHQSVSSVKHAIRLSSIMSIQDDDADGLQGFSFETGEIGSFNSLEEREAFITKQIQVINQETKKIEESLEKVSESLMLQMNRSLDNLSVYRLVTTPDKFKNYVSKREAEKHVSLFKEKINTFNSAFQKQRANLWLKRSELFLFAKKISEQQKKPMVDSLLTLKGNVSPSKDILGKLPFYYRQLFLLKYNYQPEFWFNRQKELQNAEKAFQRFDSGFAGAVMVKGDRNSGKTFFARYVSNAFGKGKGVYNVLPPPAGSVSREIFVEKLREATQMAGGYRDIFSKLSGNSIIIIDDLELWWEKSEKGNEVILFLKELIRDYGNSCMFLINCTSDSFGLINQMNNIESFFLSVIELQAFNASELNEVIMFRHMSGGFDLRLKEKPGAKIKDTELAKLCSQFFNYSGGNIGVALLSWVASITEVKDDTIFIRPPASMDVSGFEDLNPEIRIYLMQFLLHKRLDLAKLQRLTFDNRETVENNILLLKRAGLITEIAGPVFELDKYMVLHIRNAIMDNN
jgi:amino acid transporter